jgi:hypothetical protein
MLFKALIERLLGSDEAQDWKEQDRNTTSRFSYHSYPSLAGILKDLLNPNGPLKKSMTSASDNSPMDLHGAEGVFPALQILRQATPPEVDRPAIMESIRHLLDSPHWHLRDMAARTLVSLHHSHELYHGILKLLSSLETSQNSRHGSLLALKYMLKKYLHATEVVDEGMLIFLCTESLLIVEVELENITAKLLQLYHSVGSHPHRRCPITLSATLDLINICMASDAGRDFDTSNSKFWRSVCGSLEESGTDDEDDAYADSLLRRAEQQFLCYSAFTIGAHNEFGGTVEENISDLSASLRRLQSSDPNTCCALLDSIAHIVSTKPTRITVQRHDLLVPIDDLVLICENEDVLSKAQFILAESLASEELRKDFFQSEIVRGSTCTGTLDKLETRCIEGSPSNAQTALQLMGFFLDHAYSEKLEDRYTVLGRVARYIRIVRMAIIDTNVSKPSSLSW